MARTVSPTGNFLVKRKNLFIRTERPWLNEKFYRGTFARRMATSSWAIFEENPSPYTYFAEVHLETWEPVGEISEEIFDGEKCAPTLPETIMKF